MISPILQKQPSAEQEPASSDTHAAIVPFYDDGPGEANCPERELAFRQGFVEEARRIVPDWAVGRYR